MRRLTRRLFTLCSAAPSLLWRYALSPMPRLAKHTGDEVAHHLRGRAFATAFPSPGQRVFYFMLGGPAAACALFAGIMAVLPAVWWRALLVRDATLFAISFAGIAMYWRVVIVRKQRRALKEILRACGHCPACGYDLRASPGRCPECGTAAAGR